MNASGRLNTCKSRGNREKLAFLLTTGARVRTLNPHVYVFNFLSTTLSLYLDFENAFSYVIYRFNKKMRILIPLKRQTFSLLKQHVQERVFKNQVSIGISPNIFK